MTENPILQIIDDKNEKYLLVISLEAEKGSNVYLIAW